MNVYRAKSGIIVVSERVYVPGPMANPLLHLPLSYAMWVKAIIRSYRKPKGA